MNTKHKIFSLVTGIVLALSLVLNSFAAIIPFSDLKGISQKDKIIELQKKGSISGVASGKFAPNKPLTAAQGIYLIVKVFDLNIDNIKFIKEPKATDYFIKANDKAWYAEALIIATLNGFELPNDLDSNQKWTREEFVFQVINVMEKHYNLPMIKITPSNFLDQDKLTISYSGAIQRALAYNIVKLDAKGKFNPKTKITRAEAAEVVYNALEYLKSQSKINVE